MPADVRDGTSCLAAAVIVANAAIYGPTSGGVMTKLLNAVFRLFTFVTTPVIMPDMVVRAALNIVRLPAPRVTA